MGSVHVLKRVGQYDGRQDSDVVVTISPGLDNYTYNQSDSYVVYRMT